MNFVHLLCTYMCFQCVCACVAWRVGIIAICSVFLFLVEMSGTPYIGFADGACHSTWNLSSMAWVIYDPHGELVYLQGVCLGCTTNNVDEYSTVI